LLYRALVFGGQALLQAGQELAAVSCGHYGAFGYGENLDDRWAAATA
jgi:hypothetical protein